jgi:hypothetical protein
MCRSCSSFRPLLFLRGRPAIRPFSRAAIPCPAIVQSDGCPSPPSIHPGETSHIPRFHWERRPRPRRYSFTEWIFHTLTACHMRGGHTSPKSSDRAPGDVEKIPLGNGFVHSTPLLLDYRKRLEALISNVDAAVVPVKGRGLPIAGKNASPHSRSIVSGAQWHDYGPPRLAYRDFLASYMESLESLPELHQPIAGYLDALDAEQREVMATILPLIPCIEKETGQSLDRTALFEEARRWSVSRLRRLISRQ